MNGPMLWASLAGSGIGGVGLTLMSSWFWRWRKRVRVNRLLEELAKRARHAPAVLEIEPRKLTLMADWAEAQGLPLSLWATRILMDAIPLSTRRRDIQTPEVQDVMDRVFGTLDNEPTDGLSGHNVFGLPPRYTPKKTNPEPEEPPNVNSNPVPGHPCYHLSADKPPQFRGGEGCSGTCLHRTQPGRVCFWPSQTARNCPVFTPKVIPQNVKRTA